MQNKSMTEIALGSKNALLKKQIICYYINNGDNTIADLSKEILLSIPTVTKLVNELISDGFVLDFGKVETSGGRRPNTYGLNQNSGYFIGVDIKTFHINIGIINFKGKLVFNELGIPFRFHNTPEKLDEVCSIIDNFISKCGIEKDKVINIGVNLSGRVNSESGNSFSFFYFEEIPLTEVMEKKLGIRVSIDNDSRAMAYGEYINGCVQGEKNVIFINISWGLGLGMIINGQLLYGKSGFSGEMGHFPMFDNEIICHCGKKGCLETQCSGSYIHRTIIEKIKSGNSSILENNDDITLKDIVDAVLEEDVLSIELVEEVGQILGKAIAGLINMFNPELVIIGGALSQTGDYLLLPTRTAIRKYSLNLVNKDTKIKLSKLGDKAGIIGACMLARSKILGII